MIAALNKLPYEWNDDMKHDEFGRYRKATENAICNCVEKMDKTDVEIIIIEPVNLEAWHT